MFFKKKFFSITIADTDATIESVKNENLYQLLLKNNQITPKLCNGSGQCGKCKIKFIGTNIPLPTNKDKIILADININNNYRLACQHVIKSDVIIELSDLQLKSQDQSTTNSKKIDLLTDNVKITALKENPFLSDSHRLTKDRPDESSYQGTSDCIFLIQQRKSIRYYCYSAALDNIFSTGTIETDDKLIDLIKNTLISDFIHNVLNIKEIDRVLILTEKTDVAVDNFMDMISYHRLDIGTMLCEVLMPYDQNHDIIRFFRLLSSDNNNKLIISLDMLDKAYFLNASNITSLGYSKLAEPNILSISAVGKNPITAFNKDFTIKSLEKKEFSADSVTLSALLYAVAIMSKTGIIDSKFQLKNTKSLLDSGVDLSTALRLIGSEEPTGFYLYRERLSEVILTQEQLNTLYTIRSYLNALVEWTKLNILKLSGIIFFTAKHHEGIIDSMIDLGFIHKDFSDKITYLSGDSRIQAINIFKDQDFLSFLKNKFNNYSFISLDDNRHFEEIGK